jgi:ADP-heptose:LPS heptosyltransferase
MRWNPDRGHPPAKVLLIQFRRIGDAVLVTPALDALRAAWPEARIHLLTAPPVPGLFAGDARVDVVWMRPPGLRLLGLARDLRREGFDAVFDFQSLPLSAFLARRTGGYTVGFDKRGRGLLYHRSVALAGHAGSDYAADHKLDLLRAVRIPATLTPPRLVPPPAAETAWAGLPAGPRVALVPVSPRPHKRWSLDAFAACARRLHETADAVFLVAGGPGESPVLRETAAALGPVPHRVQAFDGLAPFAAALAGADLFVGNDNGPRHVAAALGVPTVAYFGPQNPTHWTPPGTDRHAVLWDAARARGRPVRRDLVIVPPDPAAAASAAARLLETAPAAP